MPLGSATVQSEQAFSGPASAVGYLLLNELPLELPAEVLYVLGKVKRSACFDEASVLPVCDADVLPDGTLDALSEGTFVVSDCSPFFISIETLPVAISRGAPDARSRDGAFCFHSMFPEMSRHRRRTVDPVQSRSRYSKKSGKMSLESSCFVTLVTQDLKSRNAKASDDDDATVPVTASQSCWCERKAELTKTGLRLSPRTGDLSSSGSRSTMNNGRESWSSTSRIPS